MINDFYTHTFLCCGILQRVEILISTLYNFLYTNCFCVMNIFQDYISSTRDQISAIDGPRSSPHSLTPALPHPSTHFQPSTNRQSNVPATNQNIFCFFMLLLSPMLLYRFSNVCLQLSELTVWSYKWQRETCYGIDRVQ